MGFCINEACVWLHCRAMCILLSKFHRYTLSILHWQSLKTPVAICIWWKKSLMRQRMTSLWNILEMAPQSRVAIFKRIMHIGQSSSCFASLCSIWRQKCLPLLEIFKVCPIVTYYIAVWAHNCPILRQLKSPDWSSNHHCSISGLILLFTLVYLYTYGWYYMLSAVRPAIILLMAIFQQCSKCFYPNTSARTSASSLVFLRFLPINHPHTLGREDLQLSLLTEKSHYLLMCQSLSHRQPTIWMAQLTRRSLGKAIKVLGLGNATWPQLQSKIMDRICSFLHHNILVSLHNCFDLPLIIQTTHLIHSLVIDFKLIPMADFTHLTGHTIHVILYSLILHSDTHLQFDFYIVWQTNEVHWNVNKYDMSLIIVIILFIRSIFRTAGSYCIILQTWQFTLI